MQLLLAALQDGSNPKEIFYEITQRWGFSTCHACTQEIAPARQRPHTARDAKHVHAGGLRLHSKDATTVLKSLMVIHRLLRETPTKVDLYKKCQVLYASGVSLVQRSGAV